MDKTSADIFTQAEALQEKAAAQGFEWADHAGALEKLREEIDELHAAIHSGNHHHITEELGDVLFAAINVGRMNRVTLEAALTHANDKFSSRFMEMNKILQKENKVMESCSLEELLALWARAKRAV